MSVNWGTGLDNHFGEKAICRKLPGNYYGMDLKILAWQQSGVAIMMETKNQNVYSKN